MLKLFCETGDSDKDQSMEALQKSQIQNVAFVSNASDANVILNFISKQE